MDLLAALYFGIVISANIRAQQVDDESQVQKETAYAGLGTGVLLIVIYGALSYVGVVSGAIATIDPTKDTGATVLTNLTSSCSARSVPRSLASCSSSPASTYAPD